nr:CP52k-like protein 1 [Capitulum mitella]
MLRLVLVAALVARSLATFGPGYGFHDVLGGLGSAGVVVDGGLVSAGLHVGSGLGSVVVPGVGGVVGGGVLDLGGLLSAGDVGQAIELVQTRYSGISSPAAVQIIRLAVSQPPAAILPRIHFRTVPSLGRRLVYLRRLIAALPPPIALQSYLPSVEAQLGALGLHVPRAALVDPLWLTDFRVAGSLLAPISPPVFSKFFVNRVLNVHRGLPSHAVPVIPSLHVIDSRLGGLDLGGLRTVFRSIVLAGGGLSGAGEAIAPVISRIGLPRLLQPAVTLGGLADYLHVQHVPVRAFVRHIKVYRAPQITRLVRPIQIQPIVGRLSFVSAPLIRRDILPTLALRYLSLPPILQSSLNFDRIVPGYFGSSLIPGGHSLSRGFVSGLLNGFDSYIHGLLNDYDGSLWGEGMCYGK